MTTTEQAEMAKKRLADAAPDLLEALHRVMRHIRDDQGGCSLSHDLQIARKAIEKAGGP